MDSDVAQRTFELPRARWAYVRIRLCVGEARRDARATANGRVGAREARGRTKTGRLTTTTRARTTRRITRDATWKWSRAGLEAMVRAAVRRAHGAIDGGFEVEFVGGERAGAGEAFAGTFVVKVAHENRRKLWSALSLTGYMDESQERACAYEIVAVSPTLSALAA